MSRLRGKQPIDTRPAKKIELTNSPKPLIVWFYKKNNIELQTINDDMLKELEIERNTLDIDRFRGALQHHIFRMDLTQILTSFLDTNPTNKTSAWFQIPREVRKYARMTRMTNNLRKFEEVPDLIYRLSRYVKNFILVNLRLEDTWSTDNSKTPNKLFENYYHKLKKVRNSLWFKQFALRYVYYSLCSIMCYERLQVGQKLEANEEKWLSPFSKKIYRYFWDESWVFTESRYQNSKRFYDQVRNIEDAVDGLLALNPNRFIALKF